MKYLKIENNSFDFLHDDVHIISKTDILISEVDYETFFESQAIGKQFRLKENIDYGCGLFGYVEEFIPEIIKQPKSELQILKEQLTEMQIAFSELKKLIPQNTED